MLVEQDGCHIKSEAILKIAQNMQQPFPALAASLLPLPGIIRDAFYDQVALLMNDSHSTCTSRLCLAALSLLPIHVCEHVKSVSHQEPNLTFAGYP